MTLSVWVVLLCLIAVNALYVLAEFGSVSVRHTRIRQLAAEGHGLASRLLPVLEDTGALDRYIAACQFGITWSSLVLGAYGQVTLAAHLVPLLERWGGLREVVAQSTAAAVVLVSLTALQVVLGELVPKSLALQYPTQVALYTVLPMRWSLALYAWFLTLLNGSGLAILKLLGIPQGRHRHIHSPEEIVLLIAESRDGGLLEPDEHRRLHQALQLSVRPARHLMVPRLRMASLDVDTPTGGVLQRVIESPYTRLPVYRGSPDNVIGMLHTKDLAVQYAEHGRIPPLEGVMRPIMSVPESMRSDRLLKFLRDQRTHQALVVDEFGAAAGLVTLEDVLAELLGEVPDEFKAGQPQPERLPDGRVRLPGLLRLDEAEPWIGVLWQGEADTVGGRVTEALGHLPVAGERVTIDGVAVEVEQVVQRTVVSVLATPIARAEDPNHG